jgi:modification methylase
MSTPATPRCPVRPAVPLALWPVAQTSAQDQRAGRYVPAGAQHPAPMLPELARRIITEYSAPGQHVVDVMAGIGTTVVEAALLDRHAVGVEVDPRWAEIARTNLDHALNRKQRARAEIRVGDARAAGGVLGDLAGFVDLICVSPHYACDGAAFDKTTPHPRGRRSSAASPGCARSRAKLGHTCGRAYEATMTEIYAGCFDVLRPGGTLVTVTRNSRRAGRTHDLAGRTVALCRAAGFGYTQHIVSIDAAIRDGELVASSPARALAGIRRARQGGEPAHLVVHEDVCVFVKPETPVSSEVDS